MTDALRLLIIAIGVAVNAVVWFRIGREVERTSQLRAAMKRADDERWNDLRSRCNQTIAELERRTEEDRAVTAQIREDTAEMMREMEFYANASDSINCTTWGKS